MKKWLGLLLAVSLLLPCIAQGKEARAYLEEAFRVYREQPENTIAVIKILTDGLATHPDAVNLLEFRGNLFCSHGMLPECRADATQLLKLKPSAVEPRMMLCMLDEFEGANQQACSTCYNEVVALLAAAPLSPTPEREFADKFNYVFALLMARAPNAEKERVAFLLKLASEPQGWFYRELLENFDRTRALRNIFGQ